MKYINALGQPCPIPVIKAKEELAKVDTEGITIQVDNIVAIQNLEKMAKGYHYHMTYTENAENFFEAVISKVNGSEVVIASVSASAAGEDETSNDSMEEDVLNGNNKQYAKGFVVAIGRDTMGEGASELGKILLKGFIFSLTALASPPETVIFFNSGAYMTCEGANTIEDLKQLEALGVKIMTCGTCVNFYGLENKLAVGSITDMYGITECMAAAKKLVNI